MNYHEKYIKYGKKINMLKGSGQDDEPIVNDDEQFVDDENQDFYEQESESFNFLMMGDLDAVTRKLPIPLELYLCSFSIEKIPTVHIKLFFCTNQFFKSLKEWKKYHITCFIYPDFNDRLTGYHVVKDVTKRGTKPNENLKYYYGNVNGENYKGENHRYEKSYDHDIMNNIYQSAIKNKDFQLCVAHALNLLTYYSGNPNVTSSYLRKSRQENFLYLENTKNANNSAGSYQVCNCN
jgi:hypothetical protein